MFYSHLMYFCPRFRTSTQINKTSNTSFRSQLLFKTTFVWNKIIILSKLYILCVYEILQARSLKSEELSDPKLSLMIAEKMAELHQLNIPINKDSTWLWDTMDRWLQQPIKDVNWSRDNMELDQILSINLCDETRWLKYEYNPCFI